MRTALAILLLAGCGTSPVEQTATTSVVVADPAAKFWRLAEMCAEDIERRNFDDFDRDREALLAEQQRVRADADLDAVTATKVAELSTAIEFVRRSVIDEIKLAEARDEPLNQSAIDEIAVELRKSLPNR